MKESFRHKLPWWTWVVPIILIELGDQISLYFQYSVTSSFYLPTSIALILIHWWGPSRVLPAVLLVTSLNNYFYGIDNLWLWFCFGLGDTIAIFLSWFLFFKIYKGKYNLPDTRNTIAFSILGLALPILVSVFFWQVWYVMDNKLALADFSWQFSRDLLGELIVHCILVLPILYYISPILSSKNLILDSTIVRQATPITKKKLVIFFVLVAVVLIAALNLEFENFWFVFGFISLYVAIEFGFGTVILINVVIFATTYLPPAINNRLFSTTDTSSDEQILRTFFVYFLLYVFSTFTGRVISDLKQTRRQLKKQNEELLQTNEELDRFVYSVSHDLTAPLKSILGLINVSRLSGPNSDVISYLTKMQLSVVKLEDFIKEILDYSRNKRLEVVNESIELKSICSQILESLQYHSANQLTKVDMSGIESISIISDKSRLYVILNNIITNAVKYQKKSPSHHPLIKIWAEPTDGYIAINIEDNGEGIRPEVLPSIFNMFYRGHLNSTGSGLGLYIAKEACQKIGATIEVKSTYGEGSLFTIKINQLPSSK